MAALLPYLLFAGILAGIVGFFAWLAAVVRRRGLAGAALRGALTAHDEAFHVTAHDSAYEIQTQAERKVPVRRPGGKPGPKPRGEPGGKPYPKAGEKPGGKRGYRREAEQPEGARGADVTRTRRASDVTCAPPGEPGLPHSYPRVA